MNKTLRGVLSKCGIDLSQFKTHPSVAYLLPQGQTYDSYAISKRNMTTTSKQYAYLIDEYKAKSGDRIEELLDDLGNKKGSLSNSVDFTFRVLS